MSLLDEEVVGDFFKLYDLRGMRKVPRNRKRNSLDIRADILMLARSGPLKTYIMRLANLSYKQSKNYLESMVGANFISVWNGNRYRTTDRGRDFLDAYAKYQYWKEEREKRLKFLGELIREKTITDLSLVSLSV